MFLPEATDPPRSVAVPHLHRNRPPHVHREVRSQSAPEPTHVRERTGRMRPAGLEIAIKEKEMTEAGGDLISRCRRAVLQQRRNSIGKRKGLREKIRYPYPATAWIPTPAIEGILQHTQKSEGIGIPEIAAAYTRSSQYPKAPRPKVS